MTVADIKHWKIFISSITWHEIGDKVDTVPLEIAINKTLIIATYGKGVHEIICNMIVVQNNKIHRPYLEYEPSKKEIYIGLELPYPIVEQATEHEILDLMKQAFLKGILQMKTLKEIKDFDFDRFYQDVKRVFYPTTIT